MKRLTQILIAGGIAITAVACLDTTSPGFSFLSLTDAFVTMPAGYSATANSFTPGDGSGPAFMPEMARGPGGDHGMLGGGMGPDFLGGVAAARGFDHGPFGTSGLNANCTLDSSTGRVTCPAETRGGLTINRSYSFTTASGTAQAKPDSTTNTVNEQITVAGTVTRGRDSSTSTVSNASNRTISGLAFNSTLRTVNGTSRGQENTTGTSKDGAFTAARLVGDTTSGLTIPVQDGKPTYPTAGTVIRSMSVTYTLAGGSPTTKSRREVITYNGTATATIVITQDGSTKTCSLPLPHGRPVCS